jgi:hypothetical protein
VEFPAVTTTIICESSVQDGNNRTLRNLISSWHVVPRRPYEMFPSGQPKTTTGANAEPSYTGVIQEIIVFDI